MNNRNHAKSGTGEASIDSLGAYAKILALSPCSSVKSDEIVRRSAEDGTPGEEQLVATAETVAQWNRAPSKARR